MAELVDQERAQLLAALAPTEVQRVLEAADPGGEMYRKAGHASRDCNPKAAKAARAAA
jgi:hypothetical protein